MALLWGPGSCLAYVLAFWPGLLDRSGLPHGWVPKAGLAALVGLVMAAAGTARWAALGVRSAWPGRSSRGESGVTSLSIVLVVPAVLLLTSTVAQMVVYYHASNLATAAAQEASRAAQLMGGTAEAGRVAGEDFLAQAGPNLVLTPQVSVVRGPDTVTAEVRGVAPRVMPGVTLRIRARAAGPLEKFEADR